MSQITRCPSCATSFKVVADQLRISEGWVRCGQCKEVFDASAHLLPAAPPALMPDMSLAGVRPPPVPVGRRADPVRGWGGGAAPAPAVAPAAISEAGIGEAAVDAESPSSPPVAVSAGVDDAAPHAASTVATPAVLEIPSPAVPAFLAVGGAAADSAEALLSLSPAAPFSWRPLAQPVPEGSAEAVPVAPWHEAEAVTATPPVAAGAPGVVEGGPPTPVSLVDMAKEVSPGGYELPSADIDDLHDSVWPSDFAASDAVDSSGAGEAGLGSTASGYPPLEIPVRSPSPAPLPEVGSDGPALAAPAVDPVAEVLPSVDFVPSPVALELMADDSPASILQARPHKPVPRAAEAVEVDDDEAHDVSQEVSFVVAARRKAFWRKPAVRVLLVLVVLLLILVLAVQIVVQERDRIVAIDARARPWLLELCEPLRCEIAPQRQIADVVIDSSSFNKARGDSYQLAFAMKSKADIPLAMPAVELTLTDAQDQPVLRRVLLPTDMAAPAELLARGEWSTSVSVIVTTGGARIAGYRLLAFYP